jgi:hypothetical protein
MLDSPSVSRRDEVRWLLPQTPRIGAKAAGTTGAITGVRWRRSSVLPSRQSAAGINSSTAREISRLGLLPFLSGFSAVRGAARSSRRGRGALGADESAEHRRAETSCSRGSSALSRSRSSSASSERWASGPWKTRLAPALGGREGSAPPRDVRLAEIAEHLGHASASSSSAAFSRPVGDSEPLRAAKLPAVES